VNVRPDPDCPDWYWVQSLSRPKLEHLVDVAYQDEPWRTPYEACSCERYTISLYYMGKVCHHIRAVRKWRKANESSIQKAGQGTADPAQAGKEKAAGNKVL